MEGEPASAKDRVLLTDAPHLVLDGAEVAAAVIGASEIVDLRRRPRPIGRRLRSRPAIAERARDRPGSSADLGAAPAGPLRRAARSRHWSDGSRTGVPFPSCGSTSRCPLKVGRRPVLVHNAETLAQVALIARHGPEWFRRLGTPDAPGSTLVTVSGAVRFPGVLEVELGTPVADIVRRAGRDRRRVGGRWSVGTAGPGSTRADLSTPYAPRPLAAVGASLRRRHRRRPARRRRAASPRRRGWRVTWPARAQDSAAPVSSACPPSPMTSSSCGRGRADRRGAGPDRAAGRARSTDEGRAVIPTGWSAWCGAH